MRGDTVLHYVVTYEQLTPRHTRPQTVDGAKSPFILENLGTTNYILYIFSYNCIFLIFSIQIQYLRIFWQFSANVFKVGIFQVWSFYFNNFQMSDIFEPLDAFIVVVKEQLSKCCLMILE